MSESEGRKGGRRRYGEREQWVAKVRKDGGKNEGRRR